MKKQTNKKNFETFEALSERCYMARNSSNLKISFPF
jgi:hypothetical protein